MLFRSRVGLERSRRASITAIANHSRWLGTKRQKKKQALAAAEKNSKAPSSSSSDKKDERKPFYATPSPETMSSSSLIRTDLKEHLDWIDSQRPSFDRNKPPSFVADPSGIVQRDLTETMINLTDMYDSRIHAPSSSSLLENDDLYEPSTPLSRELHAYIAVRAAPITVADYMRQALTHPVHGYYTNPTNKRDDDDDWDDNDDDDSWQEQDDAATSRGSGNSIIGGRGDFVTAPEVSQVFGECLCVWFITQWQAMASPSQVQLVEVGPGKGTLMSDVMTSALNVFTDFGNAIQMIHLVEASPAMRLQQKQKLEDLNSDDVQFVFEEAKDSVFQRDVTVESNESALSETQNDDDNNDENDKRNIVVRWHDSFASVMRESSMNETSLPTMVICQEFVDALPVHVFEKTTEGWRERMVDIATSEDDEQDDTTEPTEKKMTRLRYVLSPDTTPALRTLLNVDNSGNMENDDSEVGSIIEVCPEGILFVQDIAHVLAKNEGSALIVDYGQEGSADSLRAFSRHQQVNALSRPGEVDVTADVDFAALRHAVNAKAEGEDSHRAFGPVTQGQFLMSMGAAERVTALIENEKTTDEQAQDLYNALERLVLPEHMGERYKVMAIAKKKDGIFEPPGF